MRIVMATKNRGKIREINDILKHGDLQDWDIIPLQDSGVDIDIVEDGASFAQNSAIKARAVSVATGMPSLADDSGLVVPALDGEPGIYSARYAGSDATDQQNNQKLLQRMQDVQQRAAYYVCVMTLCYPDGRMISGEGKLFGEIAHAPAGSGGFGYDVIFYLPQYNMTAAQISLQQKNEISHRYLALQSLSRNFLADAKKPR